MQALPYAVLDSYSMVERMVDARAQRSCVHCRVQKVIETAVDQGACTL